MIATAQAINRILVLKEDRLCTDAIFRITRRVFPAAEIGEARRLADARPWLAKTPLDLLLTGAAMLDGETGELLSECNNEMPLPRRTLVITGLHQPWILERLRALPISGIFDTSSETAQSLATALRSVATGKEYWSPTVHASLNTGMTPAHRACRSLTLTEQIVFSVIGDGSDDASAAQRLDLTPATVQSVRRDLHRKLGVQQKGELIRLAAQYGFVRFTASGVAHPGFSQLLSQWRSRRQQRSAEAAR